MKIVIYLKDSAVPPIEIDELLSVKVGKAVFEGEKLEHLPLDEENATFSFNGKDNILTVRGKNILCVLIRED